MPPRRSRRRRRNGSRSASRRSEPRPGITASSAGRTSPVSPSSRFVSFTNAFSDGFAAAGRREQAGARAPRADARGRVLPAEPVDRLDVELLALLGEVLVRVGEQLGLALLALVEGAAALLRAGADLGHPEADLLVVRLLDHVGEQLGRACDLLGARAVGVRRDAVEVLRRALDVVDVGEELDPRGRPSSSRRAPPCRRGSRWRSGPGP